jgi:hypothetical protein
MVASLIEGNLNAAKTDGTSSKGEVIDIGGVALRRRLRPVSKKENRFVEGEKYNVN